MGEIMAYERPDLDLGIGRAKSIFTIYLQFRFLPVRFYKNIENSCAVDMVYNIGVQDICTTLVEMHTIVSNMRF